MQISKNKDNYLEIKTKSAQIIIDGKTQINGVALEGTGEYEIGEVSIEGINDNVYVGQGDDINFAIVNFKEKISKEELEKLSSVSLLFARVDENVDAAIEQVSQIEPNVAVYLGSSASRDKIKKAGINFEQTENLKIVKKDLDQAEDSYFIEIQNGSSKDTS